MAEKIEGIGGWLLFFIISLFLNGLLGLIFTLAIPVLLPIAILSVISATLLYTKSPSAIGLTKFTLWGNLIFALIAGLSGNGFTGILYSIIWLMYLSKSERVKNTYGSLKKKHVTKAKLSKVNEEENYTVFDYFHNRIKKKKV